MIYTALFLSVSLPIAYACLAMNPGEYLNCPSVPQQAGSKPLKGPDNVNGAQVYTCEAPDGLLEYDGSNMPSRVLDGQKLTCKPNSGFFSLNDGTNVKTKNFGCGTLACPSGPPEYTGAVPGVLKYQFDNPKPYGNGGTEWVCNNDLYQITDDKPNSVMKLGTIVSIVCTASGAMKIVGPGTKETFYDVNKEKFVCGYDACTTCGNEILTEDVTNEPLCPNQQLFTCTNQVTAVLADGCPKIYCQDKNDMLYLMTSMTDGSVADTTKLKCSNEFVAEYGWTYDGRALDVNARFVCGMPKGTG